MSYAGDIAVSNTFEIVIRNNTAQRQEVQLFEQGSNNPNRILDTPITIQRQPNDISEYWDLGGKWINVNQLWSKYRYRNNNYTCFRYSYIRSSRSIKFIFQSSTFNKIF